MQEGIQKKNFPACFSYISRRSGGKETHFRLFPYSYKTNGYAVKTKKRLVQTHFFLKKFQFPLSSL